jgi:hypothetical protein
LHERRMAFRRSNDEHDIHIRLQYPGWIRNQLSARTTSLKVSPGFLASGAYWPDLRQTAGQQAIEDLKIRPDHIAGPDDSNRYWTQ